MLHDQALMRSPAHVLEYLSLTGLLAVVRSPTRSDRVVQSSLRADFSHRFLVAVVHEKRNKTRQCQCHFWSWKLEQALSENRPGVVRAHWETTMYRYRFQRLALRNITFICLAILPLLVEPGVSECLDYVRVCK